MSLASYRAAPPRVSCRCRHQEYIGTRSEGKSVIDGFLQFGSTFVKMRDFAPKYRSEPGKRSNDGNYRFFPQFQCIVE